MGIARRGVTLSLVAAIGLATAPPASAGITLVTTDGPAEGFNDPTPVAPVAGNPGRTLGAQRRNVFEAVAWALGTRLPSSADIVVEANWDPLNCQLLSGTLGTASPNFVARNFAAAPRVNTWYTAAQANALAGEQLIAGPVLNVTLNSKVGTSGCLAARRWDYRIGSPDRSGFSAEAVYEHELLHGLGFVSLVNTQSGALFQDFPDTYSRNLEDHETGKRWSGMSNAERLQSMTKPGELHWIGPNARLAAASLRAGAHDGSGHPQVFSPDPFDGGSSVSHWDSELDTLTDELMEPSISRTQGYLVTQQLLQDIGWNVNQPAVTWVQDVNGNGSIELAVLRAARRLDEHKIVLIDSRTGALLREVPIPADLSAVAMAAVPNFAGTPAGEIGVLTWNARGSRLLLMIFDAGSGEPLRFWAVPPGQPRALLALPSLTGAPAWSFAVLSYRDGLGARLWILNAGSGGMEGAMGFPSAQLPVAMAVVNNFGGTAAPEMAILLADGPRRVVELKLRDARSGQLLNLVELPDGLAPAAMASLASFAGGPAQEIAVLAVARDSGDSSVLVIDAGNGDLLGDHRLPERLEPRSLVSLPDFAASSAAELVVAGRRDGNLRAKFYILDAATGDLLRNPSLGERHLVRAFGRLPHIGGSSAEEFLAVASDTATRRMTAFVLDGSGSFLRAFDVP